MAKADGGELVARIMRENRARYCFAINGGHLFPILAQLRSHEIKLIHMRHEQENAYAADAYDRMTGEVGSCQLTAGGSLDVNRIEAALSKGPATVSSASAPMPMEARQQLLQLALSLADRTL
jgi:hypothetical protein